MDFHDPNVPINVPIEEDFPRDSCLYCHNTEHKEMILCDPNIPDIDSQCMWCHQGTLDDTEPDFGCDSDKKWLHSADTDCTSCHNAVCDPNTFQHYKYGGGTLLLSIEGNWNNTGCGACHNECHLTKESDKIAFRNLKASHDRISVDCFVCHHGHYALDNINTSQCIACHIPERDVKVTSSQYLHNIDPNKDSREDPKECYDGFNCDDCHSKTHKKGKMTFTEWGGGEEEEIEKKCRICHTTIYYDVTDEDKPAHRAEAKCSNCHIVFEEIEEKIYEMKKRHYRRPINLENLEWAWEDKDGIENNDCSVCHWDEDKDLHKELHTECNTCHYTHLDLDHIQEAECLHCHIALGDVMVGDKYLHKQYEGFSCEDPDVDETCCLDCHTQNHERGGIPLAGKDDTDAHAHNIEKTCKICHDDTDLDNISIFCGQSKHDARDYCLHCHDVLDVITEEGNIYRLQHEHFATDYLFDEDTKKYLPDKEITTKLGNMEWAWSDGDEDGDGLATDDPNDFEDNHCGICHTQPDMHKSVPATEECTVCHKREGKKEHCALDIDESSKCTTCHTRAKDVMVGPTQYLHDDDLYDGLTCIECHSKTHKKGRMAFAPEGPQDYIEGKCRICHNDEDLDTISVACNAQGVHATREKCLNCHNVLTKEGNIYKITEDHYKMPTNLEYMEEALGDYDGREGNDCSVCHKNVSTGLHNFKQYYDCHDNHCELNIDEAGCAYCHQSDKNLEQFGGEGFLHNNYTGLTCPPEYDEDCCTYCHSDPHIPGEDMTFTEGNTQGEIEGKCKICHNDEDLKKISVSCNGQGEHKTGTGVKCLNCHDVSIIEGDIYKIKEEHYNIPANFENMKLAWSSNAGNDCGVCHTQPDLHTVPVSAACKNCHVKEKHCKIKIKSPDWKGDNTCGTCHADVVIAGQDLHSKIPSDVCFDCHGDEHRSSDSIYLYSHISNTCSKYCHGNGDSFIIDIECNKTAKSGEHPVEAANCNACHLNVSGVTSKHYLDAGPVNVIQSWEGPNSCGICHSDLPVAICPGEPLSIHATLGPGSNCAQCHGNHCDMNYGDTPAKCIACHSPNPAICDICGPGSITSHYAFDTMGVNQGKIQDCISCHVEPLEGGEANPLEHIDNPRTFVKEGACLGCHSLARIRHGATDPLGCYTCHPTHCVTEYARNDACIWCHTTNPPIVDICKMGIGITSHLAFDSSAFNQIQITNCIGCHVEPITGGEANPINHIDNPMTYVNPLTCMGCHTVVVPHGGSGLPWGGGVWPNVNCYSCHPTHCVSTFCNNQACVWCHTDAPLLQNVCGKPGLVPHTGDCINCHAAGVPTGGECNPADHMNGLTYVRDGTCLGCHANVTTTTHGPGTETCILCHPVHCSFTYCSEPQCKLCHNQPAFEIVSDYGCGIGLHDPPAYKECNRCHVGECNPQNHTLGPLNLGMPTDLSGMRLEWRDCGLCHSEAQAYHTPCNDPCTLCHSGTSSHACVNLDYCAENKCKCCHASATFPVNSDYGCGMGQHAAGAYINCSLCHTNECNALNHKDEITDVSNMPLDWLTCGLCHPNGEINHSDYNESCDQCHIKLEPHPCTIIPKIKPIGNRKIDVSDLLRFEINLYDSNITNLTYSSENLPSGANVDIKTGVFSWKPKRNQAGTYTVIFKVTDDSEPPLSDSETITITVQAPYTPSGTILLNGYPENPFLLLTNYYQQFFGNSIEFIKQPAYQLGQTWNLQTQNIYNKSSIPSSISSLVNLFQVWEKQQTQLSLLTKKVPFVNQYQTLSYQQNPFNLFGFNSPPLGAREIRTFFMDTPLLAAGKFIDLLDNQNPLSKYYHNNFIFTNNFTLQLNNQFIYPAYYWDTQRLRIHLLQSLKLE